jgi:hypothetical protein
MTTLTQDQLNQLHSWFGGITSGSDSTNVGGNTYSTMGIQGSGEDGGAYTPNSIVRYIPGDNSKYYALNQETGQETLMPWNKGGSLIGGTIKDLGTVAAMAGALYLGGTGLGALAGAGAGAGAGVGAAVDPMLYGGGDAATWGAGDAAAAAGAGVDPMMYGGGDASTWGASGAGTEVDPMMYGGGSPDTYGAGGGYQYGNGFDPSSFTGGNMPGNIGPGSDLAPYQYGNNFDPNNFNGANNPNNIGPPSTLAGGGTPSGGGSPTGGGTPTPPGGGLPTGGGPPTPTGGGGSGPDLSSILSLLGGAYGMNQQNQASSQMLDYLKQRQAINDNMYAAGSPEFNHLWDQMSRNDAAAGRNSQYGPRSVDLASKVAQLKMDANTKMTTGIGNLYANAINQGSNSYLNMLPGLMSAFGGGSNGSSGGGLSSILNMIKNGGSNTTMPTTPTGDWTSGGTPSPGTGYDTSGGNYAPWEGDWIP